MKRSRGTLSIAAACLLVAACSPGSSDAADPTPDTVTITYSSSTSNAPTTRTVTSSGSPTSGGGSTASPSPGEPAPTSTAGAPDRTAAPAEPDTTRLPTGTTAYADGFVRAWGAGDRGKAARYATDSTVSQLFGTQSLGGTSWQRRSASDEGSRTRVRYADSSGRTLDVVVDESGAASGSTRAVVGATLTTDGTSGGPVDGGDSTDAVGLPRSVGDYADAMIRAWGKDDPSAWDYSTDAVMTTLYDEWGAGGPRWNRTGSTSSTLTYRNKDGSVLVLTVDAGRISRGLTDGITGASFS